MNIKIPGKRQFLSQDRLHEEVKASLGPSGTLKKNSFDSLPYLKVSPFNFFWPTSSWQYWFSILWKSYAGSYQRDAKVWFSSVGQCKVMIAMIRSCVQWLSMSLWFTLVSEPWSTRLMLVATSSLLALLRFSVIWPWRTTHRCFHSDHSHRTNDDVLQC